MSKTIFQILALLTAGLFPALVCSMTSTNYRIDTDSINVGGVKQTSGNYKSEDSIGETATGKMASKTYNASTGYQATWEYPPGLSFAVNENFAPLGTLTTAGAATNETTFSVSTNAVDGYAVSVAGSTLTSISGSHINALSDPANSDPGTEQFGINLVANSTPSVGDDPDGGIGQAASGYSDINKFKYVSGSTVATASTYSKNTDFTISYLANISNQTVAGGYSTNITLIATAQF